MLYVLDHQEKTLTVVDTRPVEEWCKDTPALMYAKQTLGFNMQYEKAMRIHIARWNGDIFKWKFNREKNIADDIDG
jgi:hypothetical protein